MNEKGQARMDDRRRLALSRFQQEVLNADPAFLAQEVDRWLFALADQPTNRARLAEGLGRPFHHPGSGRTYDCLADLIANHGEAAEFVVVAPDHRDDGQAVKDHIAQLPLEGLERFILTPLQASGLFTHGDTEPPITPDWIEDVTLVLLQRQPPDQPE